MLVIEKLNGKFIVENRSRFLKRNTVFLFVRRCLCRVPFKPDHAYIVLLKSRMSKISNVFAQLLPDTIVVLNVVHAARKFPA